MKKQLSLHDNENISKNPQQIKINFSLIPNILFKAKNISDSTLLGNVSKKHRFNGTNIIHSVIKKLKANDVNFSNCDIKDCSFKESRFEKCNFNDAAHINNDVSAIRFIKCSFNQTSITDSEYQDVSFIECDFTNVIISGSRFQRCKFTRCVTSNKLIESSLLFECKFENTDIQAETIIENFGISSASISKSKIRLINKVNKKTLIAPKDLTFDLVTHELSTIERFLISYFHQPTILSEGSSEIDSTFDYKNWLLLSKNPNRFRLLIERYHDFIIYNYEKNQAPFWLILKLHKMTNELTQEVTALRADLYRSIMGVHMSLSRLVETYLQLCEQLFLQYSTEQEIKLLVNGPLDIPFYQNELLPIFETGSLSINNVIKHNSPNELIVVWQNIKDMLPLITVFLATRVKFDIQKLIMQDKLEGTKVTKAISPLTNSKTISPLYVTDIIKTEFGFDKDVNNYMIKLRAILPGDLLLQLHLELRTEIFGKIKKIILDLLPRSGRKA